MPTREDIQALQEGYSKALTFWQNFISPPQPPPQIQSEPQYGNNIIYSPGGNAALEQLTKTQELQQLQQYMGAAGLREIEGASAARAEYARQAALAARYDINVNPAVMMPQYYGSNIYGLPQMPYLMPAQEQIYRPLNIEQRIESTIAAAESGIPIQAFATSPLQATYEYNRARLGAFASSFGTLVPKTMADIAAFGLAGKIASSLVGRSILGSIPVVGGLSKFALEMAGGFGLAYLFGKPIEMAYDAIKLHNERAEAAEIITRSFVTAGPEVSPLGTGLKAGAASALGYSMMRIAERMGMASYRDIEEILKIGGAGGLFMLDQTTVDIERRLRSVIKIFGEVAKISNDPDMQKHLRNISEFYKFGGTPEAYLATAEIAGMGMRVTGQTFDQLMNTYGAMGMTTFHGMGLVPAYGAMYGIQARIAAQLAVNARAFSPERLATLGGIEGVTAALIRGQSVSAAAFANLALPSLITAQGGGMGVNLAGAWDVASSGTPLAAIARQPQALATYAQQSGKNIAQAIQDYMINSNMLQSEILKNNPLIGQVYLMNAANELTRRTGGLMTTEFALMALGVDKDTAISMVRTYGDIDSLREMRRQAMIQMNEMSFRAVNERRNNLSRFGISAQVGIFEPIHRIMAAPGRFVHESIVTPYRQEAQLYALSGTPLYAQAMMETYGSPTDVAKRSLMEGEINSGIVAGISKWWSEPMFKPGYESAVEAAMGRGFLNPLRAMIFERPIFGRTLAYGASLALSAIPVVGTLFGAPVGIATALADWSTEKVHTKALTIAKDSVLLSSASNTGKVDQRGAYEFLEEFSAGLVGP
ncbi:MAG: hypothetical protein KIH08_13755, partial [Candidatus Freyarchaeota archaeon]|nr:hypothetical protein [Candidatus Jordarchaeia archaeon]